MSQQGEERGSAEKRRRKRRRRRRAERDRGEGGVRLWAETIGGGVVSPLLQKQLEGEKEWGRRESFREVGKRRRRRR